MNNEPGITLPNLRKEQSAVKTAPCQFFSCTEEQKKLFSVNAGVPMIDALEQADSFFAAAEDVLSENLENTATSGAVLYLLMFGRATLGSAITALIESRKE